MRSTVPNLATGRPARLSQNLYVDRNASRSAIKVGDVKSAKELSDQNAKKSLGTPQSLGRGAVKISKSAGRSINVTI